MGFVKVREQMQSSHRWKSLCIQTQTPVYSLFAFFWRAPRLIHQVKERVKVSRVELPIIRTAKKHIFLVVVRLMPCSDQLLVLDSLCTVKIKLTHFLSSSLWAKALHSGQRCSRLYSIIHLFSLLCSSLVSFSVQKYKY